MEQESQQIERHIEATRDHLGRNLDELEDRVRTSFDWRSRFDRNPWLVMGIAFSGGMAISAMLSGRERYRHSYDANHRMTSTSESHGADSRLRSNWQKMQHALLAAATKKAEEFLDEVVPGFREEYQAHQHGNEEGYRQREPEFSREPEFQRH